MELVYEPYETGWAQISTCIVVCNSEAFGWLPFSWKRLSLKERTVNYEFIKENWKTVLHFSKWRNRGFGLPVKQFCQGDCQPKRITPMSLS